MTGRRTSQSWTPADLDKLARLVRSGVTAARAAVIFGRRMNAVQAKARQLGIPFEDIRIARRRRREAMPEPVPGDFGRIM
jgi:hypothetical protein